MFISERQKKILDLITEKQSLKIKELCSIFQVSEPTIRKDLHVLDNARKLVYVRGGAFFTDKNGIDFPKNIRMKTMENEKKKIAKQVVKNLKNQMVIYLDASTTTYAIAYEISHSSLILTVVTHSLEIANLLNSCTSIDVIFCGGLVHKVEKACYGGKTLEDLQQYHADVAVMSCHGISKNKGFVNGNLDSTQIKQVMGKNADFIWMCADHSKFDRSGIVQLFNIDVPDRLYTDKVPLEWGTIFKTLDIQVITS